MSKDIKELIPTILKGVGLAMGVSVVVLNIINKISVKDSVLMLAIGFACTSIVSFTSNK